MHHRADQLCFLLARGRAELRPLRIFDSRAIAWCGRRVVFYVLGASHAVSIESRHGVPILEILSCMSVTGTKEILATSRVDAPHELSTTVDDLTYRCGLAPFPLRTWTDRFAGAYPESNRLCFAYGSSHQGAPPLTYVGWHAGHELAIETVHTYPQEGQGIRTESRIALLQGTRRHGR